MIYFPSPSPDIVAVTDCSDRIQLADFPDSPRNETYTEFETPADPNAARSGGGVSSEGVRVGGLEEYQSYQFTVRVWNREGSGPESDVIAVCNRTQEAGEDTYILYVRRKVWIRTILG